LAQRDSQKGLDRPASFSARSLKRRTGQSSGMDHCGFDWLDPAGSPILNETRRMVFYAEPNQRTIDFDMPLVPAAGR